MEIVAPKTTARGDPKRPSRVTTPSRAHPAARLAFSEMARQGFTYDEIAHYSGVLVSTLKAWRTNNRPGLETLESVLGVLGWDFMPVPRMRHLSADLQADLADMAEKYELELAELRPMLIAAASRAYLDPRFPPRDARRSRPDHREAIAA